MSPVLNTLNLDTHKFLFTFACTLVNVSYRARYNSTPAILGDTESFMVARNYPPTSIRQRSNGRTGPIKNVLVSLVERKFKIFATLYCHTVSIYVISNVFLKILPTLNTFQHLVVCLLLLRYSFDILTKPKNPQAS